VVNSSFRLLSDVVRISLASWTAVVLYRFQVQPRTSNISHTSHYSPGGVFEFLSDLELRPSDFVLGFVTFVTFCKNFRSVSISATASRSVFNSPRRRFSGFFRTSAFGLRVGLARLILGFVTFVFFCKSFRSVSISATASRSVFNSPRRRFSGFFRTSAFGLRVFSIIAQVPVFLRYLRYLL